MTSDKPCWYVLRALFRSELKVRDAFRRAGFRAYVPMRWQLVTKKGVLVRQKVPAVNELVFVFGRDEDIAIFKSHVKSTVYWMMRPVGKRNEKLIVPEKAMSDFIRITEQTEREVSYYRPEELRLNKGDCVIIHGGCFDGVKGVLLKVKGKRERQLVVSIDTLTAAAVTIRPDVVEVVKKNSSSPLSVDSMQLARELQQVSSRLLTGAVDQNQNQAEWDFEMNELRRLYEELRGLRGYIANREGDISLALLMAEAVLGTVSQTTKERFATALGSLKEGCLQMLRMKLLGGVLLCDESMRTQAETIVVKWGLSGLSPGQKKVKMEWATWKKNVIFGEKRV